MPELPEVETIKVQLSKKVKRKTIVRVKVRDYSKRVRGNKKNFLAKIKSVQRRAKLIIFNLSNDYSFIVHLKMTGQLVYYRRPPKELKKATHVIFYFSEGSQLFFNDFRKFGFVKIMKTNKVERYFKEKKIGPEALEVSFNHFKKILGRKKRSKIKPVLLDQKVIAGLGNIYAQEACFKAKILPTRMISNLDNLELKRLYFAIQTILKAAIKYQGTSFDTSYRTVENQPGSYEPYVKVYHRKNCPKCKSKLKIIKQNSRSTYYCEKCQR